MFKSIHACRAQVMDSLVVLLCKWTQILDPTAAKPAVAFGELPKCRMAMEVVFQVANRCWLAPRAAPLLL